MTWDALYSVPLLVVAQRKPNRSYFEFIFCDHEWYKWSESFAEYVITIVFATLRTRQKLYGAFRPDSIARTVSKSEKQVATTKKQNKNTVFLVTILH